MLCLQVEIEKYRVENVTAEDVRHKNMSQLDQRLTETREQADWYQHKHDAAVKRVDQLKVGLTSEQSTANPSKANLNADCSQHKHDAAVKRMNQLKADLTSEQSMVKP